MFLNECIRETQRRCELVVRIEAVEWKLEDALTPVILDISKDTAEKVFSRTKKII